MSAVTKCQEVILDLATSELRPCGRHHMVWRERCVLCESRVAREKRQADARVKDLLR